VKTSIRNAQKRRGGSMDPALRPTGRTEAQALLTWICIAAVTAGIAGVVVYLASDSFGAALAVAAALAGLVWFVIPKTYDATPKWFTVFLLAMAFGTVLPTQVSFLVQAIAVGGAYIAWLRVPRGQRRAGAAVGWVTGILVFWAILVLHPNIPSLEVGVLGFRKTVFCLAGLVAGAAISRRLLPAVELTAVRVLGSAIALSVVIHQFAPGVEQSITRAAGEYTGLLGGESRLQGIFAGPFHAATACLLLIVWGIARFRTFRRLAPLMVALGFLGMYLTLVRTAYVALGLAVVALILCAPTAGKVLQRVAGAILVAFVGIAFIGAWNPDAFGVVDSITGFSTDNRFLGRFPGYAEGVHLVLTSPIVGWGSGSAGDTLEKFFDSGEHVTSHNIILKILIEGGLVGAVLWSGLLYSIFRRLSRGGTLTAIAVGALAVLLGMGLTGSSLETLPLTWFIFLFVGMAVGTRPSSNRENRLQPGRRMKVGSDRQ
jgi:O-antigen ligase